MKFREHLVPKILSGEKTVTWRLFDDKNLSEGDKIELVNWDTGEKFGEADIVRVDEKRLDETTDEEMKANGWESREQIVALNRTYYGDSVNGDTPVRIITFKLL